MADADVDVDSAAGARLGLPSWTLLFVLTVVPVVFATGFSQFEILKEAILVGGVGVALFVWGVALLRRGRVSFVAGRVLILAVAGAAYVAGSAFWSSGLLYGAVSAVHLVALVGMVVIVSAPIERPIRFVEFATAVAAGMALAATTGLLDLAGVGVFSLIWDPPGYTGAFDAMEFAVPYYAVALPVAVAGTHYSDEWPRIGFGVASVLGAIHFGLVANWTFVGLFAAACAAVAVLIIAFEGIETVTVLSPIGMMVGLVVLLNLVAGSFLAGPSEPTDATALPLLESPPGIQKGALEDKRIRNPSFSIDRLEAVRSMEVRGYLVAVAFDLFQDRPILGHGAGAWWRLQTKEPNIDHPAVQSQFVHYPAYRTPHNAFAKLLVEYGLLGFALFALWIVGCATIAIGALGRSAEHADLITEQWGLWTASIAGVLFAGFTPLLGLAPAAAVWIGTIAILTRRSAEVNEYTGASMRWELGGEEPAGPAARIAVGGVAAVLAAGIFTAITMDTVSRLYRGWGDHLMLRTYYERAIERYETADSWMPAHGGVPYNIALAKSRLGILGRQSPSEGQTPEEAKREMERTRPRDRTGGTPADAGAGNRTDGSAGEDAGDGGLESGGADPASAASSAGSDPGDAAAAAGEDAGDGGSVGAESGAAQARAGREEGADESGADQGDGSGRERPKTRVERALASSGHELLQRASRMRPHDARVLTLLAEFYVQSGLGPKGVDHARRAIDVAPNSIPARKVLATALQSMGRLDAAAKQLLAALERDPPRRYRYTIHYQLGRLYYAGLEEFAHAKEHFQKAKKNARSRSGKRRMNKKIKEVQKRIEHERKLREGKLPKGPKKRPKGPKKLPKGPKKRPE